MEKLLSGNFYTWYLVFSLILSLLAPIFFLRFVLPLIRRVIIKNNKKLFTSLVKVKFFYTLGYFFAPIILFILLSNYNDSQLKVPPKELIVLKKISGFFIIVFFPFLLNKVLTAISITFKKNTLFIRYPINTYLQLLKLLIIGIACILALCFLLNLSPWGILSGIGALGAILLLVFKDTILGLVASIQVYGGGLVKEGDWIELKSLGIDGEVLEVGLHRVKVKAWDNAITTFPTSKFLELTFKNWRNMTESGGRRIKRTIIIKASSIKFVDDLLLKKMAEIKILNKYITEKTIEIENDNKKVSTGEANKRKLTNIGCFRVYTYKYLESHPFINKKMTLLVRQLPINQYGLPLEIYTFTTTTNWNEYENIQSDIFDHLLASIKYFDLIVYQYPASNDVNLTSK